MNDWWQHSSLREKWMIILGGIIAIIILGYEFLWNPLSSSVNELQINIVKQQQLLNWMQRANQQIKQLRAAGFVESPTSEEALLVITERSLAEQKLSRYLDQVQQPTDNQLVLTFKTVPFDRLMTWLESLWRQYSINVSQMTIQKTDTPGLVQAKLTVERS